MRNFCKDLYKQNSVTTKACLMNDSVSITYLTPKPCLPNKKSWIYMSYMCTMFLSIDVLKNCHLLQYANYSTCRQVYQDILKLQDIANYLILWCTELNKKTIVYQRPNLFNVIINDHSMDVIQTNSIHYFKFVLKKNLWIIVNSVQVQTQTFTYE